MEEVGFHKNGVLILKDSMGVLHVLEPQETLRNVAKYIWKEDGLKSFRIEGEESSMKNHQDVKFVRLSSDEKDERLRTVHLNDDPYFQEY
jgi:hypothetical protein